MKRKKSIAARLGIAAFALTLVTTCMTGGTLAKYASEVTGTGTAAAAKWDVEMKADANKTAATTVQSGNFTFTLDSTQSGNAAHALVAENKVAPGSTGSVALQINVKATNEVKTGGSFEIDTTNLNGLPIKFYEDASFTKEITMTDKKGTVTSTTTVAPETAGTIDQVIYWRWDTTSTDTADTTIGKKATDAERTGTFTIKMTAEQKLS